MPMFAAWGAKEPLDHHSSEERLVSSITVVGTPRTDALPHETVLLVPNTVARIWSGGAPRGTLGALSDCATLSFHATLSAFRRSFMCLNMWPNDE